MQLIDYDDMRFRGSDGEEVRVTVEPQNSVQIVTYTLDGETRPLAPGETITFTLDGNTHLQMTFDFTDDDGGSYRVGLRDVVGEPDDECVYRVNGPPIAVRTFSFFVN